jgi:hypothetical protein
MGDDDEDGDDDEEGGSGGGAGSAGPSTREQVREALDSMDSVRTQGVSGHGVFVRT